MVSPGPTTSPPPPPPLPPPPSSSTSVISPRLITSTSASPLSHDEHVADVGDVLGLDNWHQARAHAAAAAAAAFLAAHVSLPALACVLELEVSQERLLVEERDLFLRQSQSDHRGVLISSKERKRRQCSEREKKNLFPSLVFLPSRQTTELCSAVE